MTDGHTHISFYMGKKKRCINTIMKAIDRLSEATGIYLKNLSNKYTEFLAKDGNIFLSLINAVQDVL